MEKILKNMLKEYHLTKNPNMLSDILYGLGNTDLWVPISGTLNNQDANKAESRW